MEISGKEICRVFENDFINCITASITCLSVNVKVLNITHKEQWDETSVEGTNTGIAKLATVQRQEIAYMPNTTNPTDNTDNSTD